MSRWYKVGKDDDDEPKKTALNKDPFGYLEAIARRAKRLGGVHQASARVFGGPGNHQAELRIVFYGDTYEPDPALREAIAKLRREFSSAYPEWGISDHWQCHVPTRIRRVVRSMIGNGRVIQALECGHRVDGERLRKYRVCECCSGEVRSQIAPNSKSEPQIDE